MIENKNETIRYKWAIVIVGYNRPYSLKRLINSVVNSYYSDLDDIDLIISLDYGNKQNEQKILAEDILWKYGKKRVRCFDNNLGLKKHILECGDLTKEYDAVVVLEDDLVVAPSFFEYVKQTVAFYYRDDRIAGISLYSHQTNPGNGRFFEAQYNGADVFMMQYAQSWGQCWTRKMWKSFKSWLEKNLVLKHDYRVPDYVLQWNEKSWLKYQIAYTSITGKYFVYPYFSLTSNFSESGEHNTYSSSSYQIQIVEDASEIVYRLKNLENCVKYDAFFERVFDHDILGLNNKRVVVDLYGLKNDYSDSDYLITTKVQDYVSVKSIQLSQRPHEKNILNPQEGSGIEVYDLHQKKHQSINNNKTIIAMYDFRAQKWVATLRHGVFGMKASIRYRCKNFFKGLQ